MMKFRKQLLKRVLPLSVVASLVVSLSPIMPTDQKTAGSPGAAVAKASSQQTDDETETPSLIQEVNDGKASEYGLQNTKYVDENGKEVDLEELTGSEKSVYDGSLLKRIRQDNVSAINTLSVNSGISTLAAESSYTSPYVATKVRDQGSWGVCWSFAATAAIEANIVKNADSYSGISYTKDNIDLSERHVAWFAHNTYSTDKTDISYGDGVKKTTPKAAYTGGNRQQVTAYLARSSGMALEKEAPYDISGSMKGLAETQRYSSVAQLHDSHLMGEYKADTEHINLVKETVKSYGAAMVSYYTTDAYYGKDSNKKTNYYCPSKKTENHAVCIVGWDDNYAASSFTYTPQGNGAWLIRNSWGSGWGNDGYFWMSYYDASIASIAAFKMVNTKNYGRTYQYTGGADTSSISAGDGSSMKAANVYRAQEDETLTAVGVITNANSMNVKADIYVSDEPMTETPVVGQSKATVTLSDAGMAGFHMLDLGGGVSLKASQYFSVVITEKNPNGTTWLVTESNNSNTEKKGQTFYDLGGSWVDATAKSMNKFKNACIYAYTKNNSSEKDQLSSLIKQAEALKLNDFPTLTSTDARWTSLQADIKYAYNCSNPAEVKRALRVLASSLSQLSSYNLTTASNGVDGPGMSGVNIYANGATVKENGVSKNYKTATLYHHIERVTSWIWKDKKKSVATRSSNSYKGKYIAVATTEYKKPELNSDGTLKTVDEAAKALVKLSVNTSKLTIQPKAEGDVYVWVLYYPQSVIDQEEVLASQVDYAVTKVHVSTAPKAVKLYNTSTADPVANDITYTSSVLPPGEGVDVYVKGTIGSITKNSNTVKVIEDETISYDPVVPAKYADYITVTKKTDSKHHFRIDVNSDILNKFKVKDGKTLAVTVGFKCNRNAKKGNFKLVIGNPATQISTEAGEGVSLSKDSMTGVATVKLPMADEEKQTAKITVTTKAVNQDRLLTGGLKIIKLPSADSYTYTSAGAVKAATALSASQKKVSLAATKKEPGSYTITAAKGTPGGTEAYFMLYNSDYQRENGKSHQVIKVVVGEANHVTTTTIAKREEYDTTATIETGATIEGTTGVTVVSMDSAVKAQAIQLTEELALEKGDAAGTDGTIIYKLPSLTGFNVLPNKEMAASGALLAAQKKVSLAKKILDKKTGEYCYTITAAKGTPEGTEAYFMIFHNSVSGGSGTGYQLVKVVVGTPNRVKETKIAAGEGGNVKVTQSGTTADVTIDSAVSAKVTATIKETTTLENPNSATTDSTIIYCMPDADGYEWVPNGTAKVKGALTAAQKKVTLKAVKGSPGTYTITAAKKTPAGTTVYFMLYHNSVKGGSGTGYKIIKVTVG